MRFVHQTLPQRVVFASGGSPAAVASEIKALGRSKALPHVLAYNVPSAPEAERRIAHGFGSATVLLRAAWAGAEPN